MNTLIIDTASPFLYVAIVVGEEERYKQAFITNNQHSEYLIKVIQTGLEQTQLEIKDFDRIICGIGPGSYTGLRIGLSVCKIFSFSANIPLYTLSSLDIISSGYIEDAAVIITSLRAKRNYVYTNVVTVNDKVTKVHPDSYLSVADFKAQILSKYPDALVVGQDYKFSSSAIINSPFLNKVTDLHSLVPNYLRGSL